VLFGGVVDQNVEPAECLDGSLNGTLAEFFLPNVAGDENAIAAFALYQAPGFPGIAVFVAIHDRAIRPFLRKEDRNGASDAAVTAGDKCLSPNEFVAGAISLPRVGLRSHLVLASRLFILMLWRQGFARFWHLSRRNRVWSGIQTRRFRSVLAG
jgi:hypothetical protein